MRKIALICCSIVMASLYAQSQTTDYSAGQQSTSVSGGSLIFNFNNISSCIVSDVTLVVEVSSDVDGNCSSYPGTTVPTQKIVEVFFDGVNTGVQLGNTDISSCSTSGSGLTLSEDETVALVTTDASEKII